MNRPKVFLDLDRTLIDTERLNRAIWPVLGEFYPQLDVEACVAEESEFYIRPLPDTYTYDIGEHIKKYGIDPDEAYRVLLGSPLSDGRFKLLYVDEFIRYLEARGAEVAILTFGVDAVQRFKVQLGLAGSTLRVITTLEKKNVYLEGEGECWLVDDKDLGANPPTNVHLVQVVPPGFAAPETASWPVCSNLKEVKEYLDDKMH